MHTFWKCSRFHGIREQIWGEAGAHPETWPKALARCGVAPTLVVPTQPGEPLWGLQAAGEQPPGVEARWDPWNPEALLALEAIGEKRGVRACGIRVDQLE
eukprot:9364157-Alexandrium_andersonii.AAC.1